MGWCIIDKDGLPKEDGNYMVILIVNEYKDGEKTGRGIAICDSVDFTNDGGFELTFEGYVYAWLDMEIPEPPELPDGCVWGIDEDDG